MPNIESEKINCLHRPNSRPAPRGKIESVRTRTQKSSNSLIRFRCSNSCFLLETCIAGQEKPFLAKWHPKPRKNAKRRFFDTADMHEKLYGRSRLYASAQGRHETGGTRCSFAFFESFLWHFNKKQRAEVIFRLSKPVWSKKQENGSGKQRSLHAPLNFGVVLFLYCRCTENRKTPAWENTLGGHDSICRHWDLNETERCMAAHFNASKFLKFQNLENQQWSKQMNKRKLQKQRDPPPRSNHQDNESSMSSNEGSHRLALTFDCVGFGNRPAWKRGRLSFFGWMTAWQAIVWTLTNVHTVTNVQSQFLQSGRKVSADILKSPQLK